MGKSGGRKKKGGVANQNQNPTQTENHVPAVNTKPSSVIPNGGVGIDLDSTIFLKRAHELKEEGNKRFQARDFIGALEQYENALKLIPKNHPDRAVYHSNKAACLMQMKPIEYKSVISECSMALQVQPRYIRALLRRARAFEAVGKFEMAMLDVQTILGAEPNHRDALEIARRLRAPIIGARQEAQQDLHSRPSPAALGASAIRGAPIAGLGPCLPARPVPKKTGPTGSTALPKTYPVPSMETDPEVKTTQMPKLVLKPSGSSTKPIANGDKETQKEKTVTLSSKLQTSEVIIQWRSLKLVYDHDIRLAQMPVNCNFKDLREIVSKRFPSSKSVLIKYKDDDGDLVTITCTRELRLAESIADGLILPDKESDTEKFDLFGVLKLHIVEVTPEQEPPLLEEVEEIEEPEKVEEEKPVEIELENSNSESEQKKEKEKLEKLSEDPELKEVEMDDWLFEFAQLFRTHVGIDPDAHIDLHEIGMELCSEALEETVTSEDAQNLFDKAASKFQEVAALAFFNWGNVHMCAARKRIPIDDSGDEESVATRLQSAYDWVKEKYDLAREKYEEALVIKPDFYEGLLALGQQQFEMAKLYWSFVVAKKEDLSKWDPSETIKLFDSAEEKMKSATEMWEKLEEQRAKEGKDSSVVTKKEELLKKKSKGVEEKVNGEEAAEQAAVMRSQIHLFWGNMLFERSQVECKLGLTGWKENLETAVDRFKLAGASEVDIATVLKNHCSNAEGDEKKGEDLSTDVVGGGES